jgi:signal peptidase I
MDIVKSKKVFIIAFVAVGVLLFAALIFAIKNIPASSTTGKVVSVNTLSGPAMLPTLKQGDILTFYEFNTLNRGDIVIYSRPQSGYTFVHRIVGVPGDKLQCRDNVWFINGKQEERDFEINPDRNCNMTDTEIVLKENEYFLLGDNRGNSLDSSSFGAIKLENIKGVLR